MATKTNKIDRKFILLSEKAASQKDILDTSNVRLQLNDTFMALNKQLREVIAGGTVEPLVKMQRLCLQFTYDVYNRESDLQSLMLLNKVEEQFKLVQDPDKYKKDIEHALGFKGAASLKVAPDDIVEQFSKRQRANMTKFSGFETPAEKQFLQLQKDMSNTLLKLYQVQQNQALGFDVPKEKARGMMK